MKLFIFSLLSAVITLALAWMCAILTKFIYERKKSGKRSPLSGKLLRSPGQSLISQLDDMTDEINFSIFALFLFPLIGFNTLMNQIYFSQLRLTVLNIVVSVLPILIIMLFFVLKLIRQLVARNKLRLGYESELMVGQELNRLMRDGCHVFHDFPAEDFNIDHVVVGPGGVYAIETKGRAKTEKGNGDTEWHVIYDGHCLQFPSWQEKKPLDQAVRQADWLRRWLTSAVGETVDVSPGLALPGWWVDIKTSERKVFVFSGKNPFFLTRPFNGGPHLSDQTIQRISHQLEQRCRDVEPLGYGKKKK